MANAASLHNLILPYLPGAEPPIVDFHLRGVLREFFKRTTVWREVFEFTTTPLTASYSLQPTSGSVATVLAVEVDGRSMAAMPEERRRARSAGQVEGWYALLPQVVTLYPAPAGEQHVRVHAALTVPVDGHTLDFPDGVYEAHAEALAAGVIGTMMAMPGKPWTAREAALDYSRAFGSAVRDTRSKLRDGGQPNQSTFTSPRRFGV